MLIDEIKKANMEALKAHDSASRSAYTLVVARYMERKTSGKGGEIKDEDVLMMIRKISKELDEEKEAYLAASRPEQAKEIEAQKEALSRFLPKLISEEEVRSITASLPDHSLPVVMKYFKDHYAGKCDMGMVSKIARSL